MIRLIQSVRAWLDSRSVGALAFATFAAFGLGIILLVIGIVFELQPGFSVAGLLGSLVFVVIFGVKWLDALDRRRRTRSEYKH